MTGFKSLFAAVVASAIALAPAASAQSAHFVGAGSSAQWQMAAIAADQLALNENGGSVSGSQGTLCHWTFNSGGTVSDNRDSLGRITPELGNIWLVWIASGSCSGAVTTSPQGIPDVWIALSVDSTVGVRTFSAQEPIGSPAVQTSGGQITINQNSGTAGQNKIASALYPDNQSDASLSAAVLAAVNTAVSGGLHVNVGMTDIRPEDALFATVRSMTALNTTTYAGLGYVGPTTNIGAPINTDQGTGTAATPIKFALSGKGDPFKTSYIVPAYTSIPIGAAPIVFITNNGGTYSISNMVSGVTPDKFVTGQIYPLSQFFGGKVACDTDAQAFGGNNDGKGTALTVFLREPLSGTMNTTEFSLFRSVGQDSSADGYGTQEYGVTNPTRSPYNPLALGCPTHGSRERAIGTGEVVGSTSPAYGLLGNANSIGYIFYGFGNAKKLTGSGFNYLTLDGVDPLYASPSANPLPNQELPNCTSTTCSATSEWPATEGYPAGFSYPHLRDGTYKAWSIYRWLIANSNIGSDPYGFDAVAQAAQDYVDSDVADFVPFLTSSANDGLSVYHAHFTQETVAGNDGNVTTETPNGNTRGGGPEAGGDEGGFIEGPFDVTVPSTNGYALWAATAVGGTGKCKTEYKLTWEQGPKFTAGTSWENATLTLNGTETATVSNCIAPTATIVYLTTGNPAPIEPATVHVSYSAPFSFTGGAPTDVITTKQ